MRSAKAIILQSNGGAEKVCRNLFGFVDHERLKMDYETIINNTIEEAKLKWNFDFVSETPLEGVYKWEKVDCLNSKFPDTGTVLSPNMIQGEKETTCQFPTKNYNEMSCRVLCQELEGSGSSCCKRKTLITDFFPVKRRCSPLPSPNQCSP